MQPKRYLTFRAGPQTMAVLVENVQEISENRALTRIPFAPDHVLGITNLRGSIVPVVCLRRLLEQPVWNCLQSPVLLVLRLDRPDGVQLVASLVDQVLGIEEFEASSIRPLSQGLGSHGTLTHSFSANIILHIFQPERNQSESIVNI